MPKENPNYSEPMHCLAGSPLWQEILGNHVFLKKHMFESKNIDMFAEKMLSAVPKRIRLLILNPYERTVFPQISKAVRGSNSLS